MSGMRLGRVALNESLVIGDYCIASEDYRNNARIQDYQFDNVSLPKSASRSSWILRIKSCASKGSLALTMFLESKIFGLGSLRNTSRSKGLSQEAVSLISAYLDGCPFVLAVDASIPSNLYVSGSQRPHLAIESGIKSETYVLVAVLV